MAKANDPNITQSQLKEMLHYDPETGEFTWRSRADKSNKRNIQFAGKRAGTTRSDGRRDISINKRYVRAHRLAWLYMTGEWPKETIDHINRNPGDNRFCNLREATHAQQLVHRRTASSLGVKGVKFHKNRFHVVVKLDGKDRYLGGFKSIQDAVDIVNAVGEAVHGEFYIKQECPSADQLAALGVPAVAEDRQAGARVQNVRKTGRCFQGRFKIGGCEYRLPLTPTIGEATALRDIFLELLDMSEAKRAA